MTSASHHTPASYEGDWRRAVEPYVGPDSWRAAAQTVITLGALGLTFATLHLVLSWSLTAALLFVPLLAGLIVRSFIIMHDCAHGSLFASRRTNDIVGFLTGVLTLTPFGQWRRDHALHHASSGDLDRRGHGDVPTLTVREYLAKSRSARAWYRIVRHPALLLGGGPTYLFLGQRWRARSKATGASQAASVMSTNVGIAILVSLLLLSFGWKTTLIGYVLPFYLAASAGIWLFYVQHQFEDAYWADHAEWNYVDAALRGSSHLQLNPVLRWFTGSIGLHHVHHLAPRIPNFRLQQCHDENPQFHRSPVVTLRSGWAALRLSLWDEERQRLVRFSELRTPRIPPAEEPCQKSI